MSTTKEWQDITNDPLYWPGGVGTIAVTTGPFTLQYSVDGGTTWITAAASGDPGYEAASNTSFNFELPGKCQIRAEEVGGVGRVVDVSGSGTMAIRVVKEAS